MDEAVSNPSGERFQLSRRGVLASAGVVAAFMSIASTLRAHPAYASSYIWPVPPNGPNGTYTFHPEGDWGPRNTAPSPHNGLDFQRAPSTPIWAIAQGQVIAKSPNDQNALGNWVQINHQNGVWSRYGHFQSPSPLSVGAWMNQGDTIGYMGNTGTYSTGVHLHLDIMVGSAGIGSRVDPEAFLRNNGAGSPTLPVLDSFNGDLENIDMYLRRIASGSVVVLGGSFANNRHVFTNLDEYAAWRRILTTYNSEIDRVGGDSRGKIYVPPANAGDVVGLTEGDWGFISTVYGVSPNV